MFDFTLPQIFGMLSGGGILGFIGTIVTYLFQRRKLKGETAKLGAEGAQILTASAISLLEPMKQEIAELRKELRSVQEQATEMRIQMRKYLVELGEYRELTTGEEKIIDGY